MASSSSSSSSSHVGFSIREYTAEMRETDITKCYPFSGYGRGRRERTAEVEEEEEVEESFLPPIRVVKFRWWLDVLAAARSRKEIDLADAISLGSVIRRGSGLCSARADDDDCAVEAGELRIKKKKKKKKKQKKKERSIVEIFAVSPRVVARAKKQARATSKKKKKKKKKKRVKAKVKTRGSITGTRVFETMKVLGIKIHDERSSTTRIDEVMLEKHGSIFPI